MKAKQLITGGIAATNMMTAYSYVADRAAKERVLIPELLGMLSNDMVSGRYRLHGWITHYLIGIAWSAVFYQTAERHQGRAVLVRGLTFGLFSGLTGIAVWQLLFRLHGKPYYTSLRLFRRHLLIAHVVYGETLALRA